MKRIISTFFLLSLVVAFLSCEKGQFDEVASSQPSTVVVDDDEPTNPSDDSEKSDDSDKSDNSDNSDSSDNSDDSDSSSDDGEDDTSLDDRTTPYEEPNIEGEPQDGEYKDKVLSVSDFLTLNISYGVYVEGYIVGTCKKDKSYAKLKADFSDYTYILLADDPNEKDVNKMMGLEAKKGTNNRKLFDEKDAQTLYQHKISAFGYREKHINMLTLVDVSDIQFK